MYYFLMLTLKIDVNQIIFRIPESEFQSVSIETGLL